MNLLEPANTALLGIPGPVLAAVILSIAVGLFCYVMYRRIEVLRRALPDARFTDIGQRLKMALVYGFGQARQPRYPVAGILHILLFAGFIVLSLRSLTLIGLGFSSSFHLPLLGGTAGVWYEVLKDYTVLVVLIVCIVAIIRRAVFKPARYEHAGGGGHGSEAYVILGLVSGLMITDMLFDGTAVLASTHSAPFGMFPAANVAAGLLGSWSESSVASLHLASYWAHILVFFGLLNYLPISKHFHVITAIPNVFFANLDRGAIKPVRWGVDDWMELDEVGVGRFNSFTWKHVLDFYSCADCGRCSDNCPATTVGRTLAPRMISIKVRDYAYERFPVFGAWSEDGDAEALTGGLVTEEEIWACTTCGACEAECPIFIEYIDKIVDMRRFLVEQGSMPQSLQKPLQHISKKGNAYGGAKNKRAAWTKDLDGIEVRELGKGEEADLLFFVDSCGSFDPRIQELSRSFARILERMGANYGILGKNETDSGNEVRRLGEEGLFEQLAEQNMRAFQERTFKEIVTFDPHAFNAIRNDYPQQFPVIHASQLIARQVSTGALKLRGDYLAGRRLTYHDPCYLGRHNGIYQPPREVLNAIPGMQYVEMERSHSRSFCCSGGGALLWYENEQETERMGERRVRMAQEAGAEVIVTACPFCLINLEDAIKTTGNEGKIEALDMVELIDRCLGHEPS